MKVDELARDQRELLFADDGTDHVVVVHRWRDRYAHYDEYLDHSARPVSYVTTEVGRESVPEGAAEVVVLPGSPSIDDLRAITASLSVRFGRPRGIIALKEGDLPVVSRLREELGTAGRGPAELHRFLDKYEMAEIAHSLGVPMPDYALVRNRAEAVAFAARTGWPVIVKPLRGSASHGVHRLDSEADLELVSISQERPMLIEQYLPYPVIHVDGLYTADGLGPWRASWYVNTPLKFVTGDPLGSVEIDDLVLLAAIEQTLRVLIPGLSAQPWIFHLELFCVDDEPGGPRCVFIEVGCRVGGAEIPWIWREVHGMDLMHAECSIQLGSTPWLPAFSDRELVGGWLLMPLTVPRPCRVLRSTPMTGPGGPYAEYVPAPGTVIPAADAFYEHVGGRFRFCGPSTEEVAQAVRSAAAGYQLSCEPLAVPSAVS